MHVSRRAQHSAIQKNDRDTHSKADPRSCRPYHFKYAHHQHLQLGRYLFCGPDLHQRIRCGGHCFQPDGHYSGAWLYTGPRLRHHHQPQPWQPEHRCRHPLCFHQLFYCSGRWRGAGRCGPCHSAQLHDAAGQHRDHSAPRLRLCTAHPHCSPAYDLQPCDEQHPAL